MVSPSKTRLIHWKLKLLKNTMFVRIHGEDKEYVYTKKIRVDAWQESQDPGKVYKAYLVG